MNIYLAELVGTAIMILLGGGVVASVALNKSKAQASGWIVITMAWGFAVLIAVCMVGKYSGAHLNPAVTLALALTQKFAWSKVIGYIIAQFLGAFLGATLVWLHFKPHFKCTENAQAKRDVFCTMPAILSYPNNLISETIGTFVLILGILAIGLNQLTGGIDALFVGFLVMAIGMSLGATTGYAINPARDLGPRIAYALLPIPGKKGSDWAYAFVPVIGPIAGSIMAAGAYGLLYRAIEPDVINPLSISYSAICFGGGCALFLITYFYAYLKMKTLKGAIHE